MKRCEKLIERFNKVSELADKDNELNYPEWEAKALKDLKVKKSDIEDMKKSLSSLWLNTQTAYYYGNSKKYLKGLQGLSDGNLTFLPFNESFDEAMKVIKNPF